MHVETYTEYFSRQRAGSGIQILHASIASTSSSLSQLGGRFPTFTELRRLIFVLHDKKPIRARPPSCCDYKNQKKSRSTRTGVHRCFIF